MSGRLKSGPAPKGGKRHSIRFRNLDVYESLKESWQKLGFEDLSAYVDFTVSLAHGKWEPYGFESADEAADYLLALSRGEMTPPPHLRGQPMLPLTNAAAA
ncbi:hypothetical protein ACWDRB_47755 [Nonomuraea sp. NPDC003707]